ncbi:hypothetical protein F5B20DRAFT_105788 [Whalleya microplaca]|nr:hypothetical protein F5B20DRAFT_105788 [Whalleya microplaca]
MSLRHIALPSWPLQSPPRFPSYALATRVQSKLQQDLLAWKAAQTSSLPPSPSPPPPPLPTLLSFTPSPTYTLGRRQTTPLTRRERERLRAPLRLAYPGCPPPAPVAATRPPGFRPQVAPAPRGGLATYHGPGQVVLWPVIDLRSPLHAPFSVRAYACLLEQTTVAALARLGIGGLATTADPGVWVRHGGGEGEDGGQRKIAALGVHLRRHVTGLGVAINVGMPVTGTDETLNPWARIDACGLGDKGITSVAAELAGWEPEAEAEAEAGSVPQGEEIASLWASEFAARLQLRGGDGGVKEVNHQRSDWDRWKAELGLDDQKGAYDEARPLTWFRKPDRRGPPHDSAESSSTQ